MEKYSHKRTWDDLVAQADALLGCGTDFWLQSGLGLDLQERLSWTLALARDSECAFCSALTARLDAMVRRQKAQQETYDFLAECRRRLKGLPAVEWVRVATEPDEQVSALEDAVRHLGQRPQEEATGLTGARAGQLRRALELALHNVDLSSGALRAAATNQRLAVDTLHRLVTNISHHLRARLRSGDPRWLGLTHVDARPPLDLCPGQQNAGAEKMGAQPSLKFGREIQSDRGLPPIVSARRKFQRRETQRRAPNQLPLSSLKLTSALALIFPPTG